MIKKLSHIFFTVLISMLIAVTTVTMAFADNSSEYNIAIKINSKVLVDNENVDFDAYNINGNNYFRLRDLAYILNGTKSQFEINWNDKNKVISIATGEPYTILGDEMSIDDRSLSKVATKTNSKIVINSKENTINTYNIDGYTYFKLRDIGDLIGLYVEFDKTNNSILIDTTQKVTNATVKNFLKTSIMPVGKTLYIYGGGWNKEDTGAGDSAKTIGLSPKWYEFYLTQNKNYNHKKYSYQIELGLDCTGFIGWAIYNTLETENGKDGYVYLANEMVDKYADTGMGKKINKNDIVDYKPGDILASKTDNHAWICIGQCSDGSVLFVHSSPPGVSICGTPTKDKNMDSEAVKIATKIMSERYPDWYKRYPSSVNRNIQYLKNYDMFRWNIDNSGLLDPDQLTNMNIDEIVESVFN